MDEERFQELWTRLNGEGDPLSDDELAELDGAIGERAATVNRDDPTAEDLAALREAREMRRQLAQVQAGREAEREAAEADRAARAAEAAELLAEIGEAPAGGTDEVQPAEPDPATPEPEPEPEATTAAGEPVRPASISRLAARQPKPRPSTAVAAVRRAPALLASADLPGLTPGEEVDLERWAMASARRIDAILASTGGVQGEKIHLGKLDARGNFPEERVLDANGKGNQSKIADVLNRTEPLAAAGGICGPVQADYNLSSIASADRPARDGMMNFGATRGGVRFVLPHTLPSVTALAPATLWTAANDASPSSPTTKPHATFVCQTPTEVNVDAVTSIAQFGNFQARYFPEQIAQFMDTVDAVHARVAEATLLASMISGSTAVNAGNNGTNQTGAATEMFAEVSRASAHARYVHRIGDATRLQYWIPDYLEDMIRADIARELPGGTIDERLAVADAQIARWFDAANIDLVVYVDSPTGAAVLQGWTQQAIGDLQGWPTKVLTFLTHPGAWTFLDGGELNLGMVRDSTLNATNDFQMFSETFEKAVFRGHFSWAMTLDLCPDGARAATVDTTTLCATGS